MKQRENNELELKIKIKKKVYVNKPKICEAVRQPKIYFQ